MRILHLAPYLKEGGSYGFAADLAHALQEFEQTENILLAPAVRTEENRGNMGIRRLLYPKPSLLGIFRSVPRLRRIVSRLQPDILLAYSGLAAWEAGMACRKLPEETRPIIVGVMTTYPNLGSTARGMAFCNAITTVSRHLREVLEDFSPHVRHKAAWMIPYGVDGNVCNPSYGPSDQWLRQWESLYPNPGKRLTLCLPGAISPRRGHEDIVPLMAALQRAGVSARVLIAGDETKADASFLRKLHRKFEEARIADDICWIGARHDMRDVFCASDIILSLNREPAAYDRVILEALALGCPVVGYDHGVVGDMLRKFLPEGCVPPGNTEFMADTIYQWSIYPPGTPDEIPYPYRMSDTAENYMTLFHTLLDKELVHTTTWTTLRRK